MINAAELKIGDIIKNNYEKNAIYKVVEFDSSYGINRDKHGVRIVRFIKSRNDWAVAPKAVFCKEDGELNNWSLA